MTAKDKQDIATLIADELANHQNACPLGLDHATAEQLRDMAQTWKKSRTAMIVSIVGLLVTAFAGLCTLGLFAKVKEVLK